MLTESGTSLKRPFLMIQRGIAALRLDFHPRSERGVLVRQALGTISLRAGALLIAFIASILYARTVGAYGYGLYAYVLAWSAVVAIPAGLGLSEYLVREAAKNPEPGRLRQMLRWADRRLWVAGTLGMAALAAAGFVLGVSNPLSTLFFLVSPLPLLNSLAAVRQSVLRTMGATLESQWASVLFAPTAMLLLLVGWWVTFRQLTPELLLLALLGATILTFGIQWIQARRATLPSRLVPTDSLPLSLRRAVPFMMLGAVWMINSRTDLLILGSMKGAREAGVYAAVTRIADLVGFALTAANTVIAPRLAHYYHAGQYERLQRLLSATAHRTFLLSLPVAGIFIIAAKPMLNAIFGTQYEEGGTALSTLACAQLFNVAAGSVGLLLNMSGNEKLTT